MKLTELLSLVSNTAKDNNISEPFMVGGVPRDRLLGKKNKATSIKDVDITTGDKDSSNLAILMHKRLPGSNYRNYDDGHSSLDFRGLHIDFSSNFIAPGVEEELKRRKVSNIDSMKLEIYSRDFTINTLLESLDFGSLYDITGEGIGDLRAGLIRCPVDPNITIGNDPRRILRAIKFAVKYDLKIDDMLRATILERREDIRDLPKKFVQDKISEIVNLDNKNGIDMLIEYKILPLVQLPKMVYDILIQRRQLARAM